MAPTERILDVLEYLSTAGLGPVKQVDMVRDLGMSPATLNRIVRILSDRGYLFRTSEKYLVRNFSISRTIEMSSTYIAELDRATRRLTELTGAAAESIVVMGHELLWHNRSEHADPSVRIVARAGFRRSLLEFDALSRLYLSTLSHVDLETGFDMIGFFETGSSNGREINWLRSEDVLSRIAETRGADFACDRVANHMGIRRFATLVRTPDDGLLHILSLADNAPPGTGEGAIASRYREVLAGERERLEAVLAREYRTDAAGMPLRIVG
ncbi:DNA-binding IclR family transcriptional regulator [Palleronia aestuarii]|uniref:DNA-binding IclR family transcriptional regulator n=1 Tax=Palleronia aestuarii TaxID=568105 RepID=A0A2W7MYP4_9RHOB|nr:MarR family transcriptional regulator [Palleronia aestuarii]PZX11257.1 DNA-binding IclR family transcriptional regulator [Palleronia aestuarii]